MKSISPALFAPLATAGVINPVKIGNIDTARLLSWQTQTPCPPPPTLQLQIPTLRSRQGPVYSNLPISSAAAAAAAAAPRRRTQFPKMFPCTLSTEPGCRQRQRQGQTDGRTARATCGGRGMPMSGLSASMTAFAVGGGGGG
ncbi:uncharacterized protein L3040_006092 [Drepanopeziza brunnea f. sp. 'multigermtubi']|uniref:uncharacterized protein n=1 Tax=Drepanopeziza brunnea f. sp. 'multigermtubi' TaxID=698441 RepID=UPI00238A0035|nr:hypothetical protein L3040_006092 [Drepanopeziza brunnea f. sp. 'multigermtubi']